MLSKRVYENLLWIREMRRAGGLDTKDLDAKIEKLRHELQDNPTAKSDKQVANSSSIV